jgi:hypothetical protein
MEKYYPYNFKDTKTYADNKVITFEEHSRVLDFVNNGIICGSNKRTILELVKHLRDIGYKAENHHSYTFKFSWNNKQYAPDIRHVYIEELNDSVSFI